jgi:RHS repeat-associated protein
MAVTDASRTLISQQRYLPFGGVRENVSNISQTDYGYTGQRNLDSGIGLMDYKARFYSPYLNRFIQPDTIVPDLANPQAWNRYSYTFNNPIRYNDPTGHCPVLCIVALLVVGAFLLAGDSVQSPLTQPNAPPPTPANGSNAPVASVDLSNILPPINAKDAFCSFTGEPYLCHTNFTIRVSSHNQSGSEIDLFEPAKEIISYIPDIAEYRGVISNTAAFKFGFGIDGFRQWGADAGKGYDFPTRAARSMARGVQGIFISGASNMFALPIAAGEEFLTPILPGDGLISYTIAYVSANKALSNATEPFMQKTVFPTISRGVSLLIPK